MAAEAIQELVDDLLGVELVETWQPRDPITYTYVVDTPPTISFAEVLVAVKCWKKKKRLLTFSRHTTFAGEAPQTSLTFFFFFRTIVSVSVRECP
jgi:hypothetical protein